MKIETQIYHRYEAGKEGKTAPVPKTGMYNEDALQKVTPPSKTGDAVVEISSRSKETAMALDTVKDAPETRDNRINELKEAITSGDYTIDPEAVAKRILA